jgi:hypothetical protein
MDNVNGRAGDGDGVSVNARKRGRGRPRMNCPDSSAPILSPIESGRGRTQSSGRCVRDTHIDAPPVIRSKRGTFQIDEEKLPDLQIEVSLVVGRLKRILGLLDQIPPHPVTEQGFRLVRGECVEFKERMVWLQSHAQDADGASRAGKPETANPAPQNAPASETEFPSSSRCFESPRPSGRVQRGPEGISSLKTSGSGEIDAPSRKSRVRKNSAHALSLAARSEQEQSGRWKPSDERWESTGHIAKVRLHADAFVGGFVADDGAFVADLECGSWSPMVPSGGSGSGEHFQRLAAEAKEFDRKPVAGVPVAGCLENPPTVDSRSLFFPPRFYMTYIVQSYRNQTEDERLPGL